jgi:hypothetical protein
VKVCCHYHKKLSRFLYSGDFLPASPPGEKATARVTVAQAAQTCLCVVCDNELGGLQAWRFAPCGHRRPPGLRLGQPPRLGPLSTSRAAFAGIHDAPRPLRRDKLRPVAASLGGRALDDPLQLSKNIRCFSNMRRVPSSASSSDSAIPER